MLELEDDDYLDLRASVYFERRAWVRVGKIVMLEGLIRRVSDPEFRAQLEDLRAEEVAKLPTAKKIPNREDVTNVTNVTTRKVS